MTFPVQEPGAKGGTISANNVAWLENGDSMSAVSSGVFSESGTNTWRVRAMVIVSDGTVLLSEGEVSLAERTYKGKMYAWE
jgi:predicted amidohydrolase